MEENQNTTAENIYNNNNTNNQIPNQNIQSEILTGESNVVGEVSNTNSNQNNNIFVTENQNNVTQPIQPTQNIEQNNTNNPFYIPNTNPQYEEVVIERKPEEKRTDSYFDGKLLELFGWSILKNLITIITLGIAGPWGKCMMLNYEINHTVINGKRLKFVGTGGSLFVERFKWIFFTIITLGIYGFWIPVKNTKWILSNIHFEDEDYVKEESYFDGKVIQLIGINILCNFLNVVSLYLLYPFTVCIKLKWIAKHSVINRKKIVFEGTGIGLLGHYLLWLFLTLITFGIYGLWLNIKMTKWKVKNSRLKLAGEEEQQDKSIIIMVIIFVIMFIISVILLINNPFNINFDPSNFGPEGLNSSTQMNENDYYNNNYLVDTYYGY